MTDDVSEKRRNRERRQLVKKQQRKNLFKDRGTVALSVSIRESRSRDLKTNTAGEEESFRPKGHPIFKLL
jgi:hypothetical protein